MNPHKGERRKKMKNITYEFKDNNKIEWFLRGEDAYYTTNSDGRGIFKIHNGERSQLLGAEQFSLAGLTKSSARAKIRKFMLAR